MSSHPCDTVKAALQGRWLLIGGLLVYKMSFWGIAKWPPIGGWLLIRVAVHNRFYCTAWFYYFKTTTLLIPVVLTDGL